MSNYPKYCCQDCGAPVGYLGRFFEWLFGRSHDCRPPGAATPKEPAFTDEEIDKTVRDVYIGDGPRPRDVLMQTRTMSLLEVCASTAVGYVVAVLSQVAIFPMFGIHIPFRDNLLIGFYFTLISVARGYFFRRIFNRFKARL